MSQALSSCAPAWALEVFSQPALCCAKVRSAWTYLSSLPNHDLAQLWRHCFGCCRKERGSKASKVRYTLDKQNTTNAC